ncbi:MAG TPA: hypothetical protein VN634_20090 [Candidatus Limnocylindrales bacterium]|nr:hypothetical protein [Candidatus Limnocylindrales bacterium]
MDITAQVRPPRTAFLDYPMGNEIGRPNRPDEQGQIVRSAFAALAQMTEPGTIVDLGFRLDAESPEGKPWRDWVYTKEFRRYHMKTRDGERPA